jgi:hypothetical protein
MEKPIRSKWKVIRIKVEKKTFESSSVYRIVEQG